MEDLAGGAHDAGLEQVPNRACRLTCAVVTGPLGQARYQRKKSRLGLDYGGEPVFVGLSPSRQKQGGRKLQP